jgi:hypothetical protein
LSLPVFPSSRWPFRIVAEAKRFDRLPLKNKRTDGRTNERTQQPPVFCSFLSFQLPGSLSSSSSRWRPLETQVTWRKSNSPSGNFVVASPCPFAESSHRKDKKVATPTSSTTSIWNYQEKNVFAVVLCHKIDKKAIYFTLFKITKLKIL